MNTTKNMNTKKNFYTKVFTNFTIAKFISALITITMLAVIKYAVCGNIYIDSCHLFTNIGVGLLGFTINTGFSGLLSEYLGLKGLNLNLKELVFGFEKIQVGVTSPPKVSDKLKVKVYLTMDSDEQSSTTSLDKGKDMGYTQPFPAQAKGFSGRDPTSVFWPKTIPGPGFNVPGGEVPIKDDICKYIHYNTHILKQFKTMDLQTAIEQINNYHILIREMNNRLAYAQNALNGLPLIPTTDQDFHLRNQILKDLKKMQEIKNNAEGRAILIHSRIEFIEIKLGKK